MVDTVLWHFDERGLYNVKSGCHMGTQLVASPSTSDNLAVGSWWNCMWRLYIPLKIKIFIWKACHDWIPTNSNLLRRGIQVDARCPLCGTDDETTMPCGDRSNVWDILSWSNAFVSDRYPATGNNFVQASLERVKWKPSDQGEYKINCKAVIHRDCGWIGFGIVIRDSLGLVMASCSVRTAAGVDSWAANALAIRNGIQFGSECGIFPFSIEFDAKGVVDGINKSTHQDSNYGSILLDIAS
ncbi:hypothetical protein Dsin_029061 [Dipteronia sinensis]|uniref:Reverse transcriptase zinc-binding domain-containing protein n=1 Tax=Dipteronia sinensis TaxID=43782 RepID=A0AAD9ZSE5_9ROSI|nr:hypothetical protein Dsin_029061 [Dipteronia sinensis]